MALDMKAKIAELVEKIKSNPQMLERFRNEPVKVIEELLGVDLPDDVVKKIIDAVKAMMVSGEWDVFSGVKLQISADGTVEKVEADLVDNQGNVIVAAGGLAGRELPLRQFRIFC